MQAPDGFPVESELAALRASYAGLSSRKAVDRYLPDRTLSGQSSRGMLGRIRQRLIGLARERHRIDIADTLNHPVSERTTKAKAVAHPIETLHTTLQPIPRITDDVSLWLSSHSANALNALGVETLVQLSMRVLRRLRFMLDFAYATGLRSSELVGATLSKIETDAFGDHWIKLVGKGIKAGKVARWHFLPWLAWRWTIT